MSGESEKNKDFKEVVCRVGKGETKGRDTENRWKRTERSLCPILATETVNYYEGLKSRS